MATLRIPNYHFFDYLYFRIMERSPLQITPLDGRYRSLAPPVKDLGDHRKSKHRSRRAANDRQREKRKERKRIMKGVVATSQPSFSFFDMILYGFI